MGLGRTESQKLDIIIQMSASHIMARNGPVNMLNVLIELNYGVTVF